MSYYSLLIFAQAISPDTAEDIRQTAENTAFMPWTAFALFVAILSAIFAGFSMYYAKRTLSSQVQTECNTYRLEPEVQKDLLIEMCRHLYRNMVCSYTLGQKMVQSKFLSYPSEEHLAKMKVNLEDIHDELFYKQETEFFAISKLYVLLRNYNAELDIMRALPLSGARQWHQAARPEHAARQMWTPNFKNHRFHRFCVARTGHFCRPSAD